jgi:hypothetical protein
VTNLHLGEIDLLLCANGHVLVLIETLDYEFLHSCNFSRSESNEKDEEGGSQKKRTGTLLFHRCDSK